MEVESADLRVMEQAIDAAARPLLRDFGELEALQAGSRIKPGFLGRALGRVESILEEKLSLARPRYDRLFRAGSTDLEKMDSPTFFIEALSGRESLAHAIPEFCLGIGLVEPRKGPVCGIIYDPMTGERYSAELGSGAWRREVRLRASGRNQLTDAMISLEGPGILAPARGASPALAHIVDTTSSATKDHEQDDSTLAWARMLLPWVQGGARVRTCQSPLLALAWLAAGRLDVVICESVTPATLAASLPILRESGIQMIGPKVHWHFPETTFIAVAPDLPDVHPSWMQPLRKRALPLPVAPPPVRQQAHWHTANPVDRGDPTDRPARTSAPAAYEPENDLTGSDAASDIDIGEPPPKRPSTSELRRRSLERLTVETTRTRRRRPETDKRY